MRIRRTMTRVADQATLGRLACCVALVGLIVTATTARAEDPAADEGARLFEEKIAPVLKAECYRCHSEDAEKVKGGLRLDSREAMLKGGDNGPAVVPNKSDESLLLQAIRHEGDLAMPPKKPRLSDEVIATFVKWIDRGAPGMPEGKESSGVVTAAARRHWAFQPVKKVTPPIAVKTD